MNYLQQRKKNSLKNAVLDIEDKNPADENGTTPLHFAAEKGYLAICLLIMDHAVDLQPKNKEGKTPYDLASHEDVLDAMRLKLGISSAIDDSIVILDSFGPDINFRPPTGTPKPHYIPRLFRSN